MAARSGLSQSTVSRIWRAFGLQPHRTETFKLSPDPLFIEKVRDIVGLSRSAGPRLGVVCRRKVAEPSPGSESAAVAHAARAGRAPHPRLRSPWHDLAVRRARREERPRHRHVPPTAPRGGVSQVPRYDRGRRAGRPRCAPDPRQLRDAQDSPHPALAGEAAPLPSALHAHRHVPDQSRRTLLTQKQLRRGVHCSTRALEAAIMPYIDVSNVQPKPFVWTKTADEILASVERFCRRISDSRD
jgi:hypothetical protein